MEPAACGVVSRVLDLSLGSATIALVDPAAPDHPLRAGAALLDLSELGAFRVTGDDRVRFLNGMLTANIPVLLPGAGCAAFQLDHKGHVLALLDVLCRGDQGFVLACERAVLPQVMGGLERYVIADKVELADLSADHGWIGVEGPRACEVALVATGAARMPAAPFGQVTVHAPVPALAVRATWSGADGVRFLVSAAGRDALVDALVAAGAVAVDPPVVEAFRIERGVPRHRRDFDERNLVQETGMLHAVAIGKGCYRGQETFERVRSRGGVNRVLAGLLIDGEPPAPGTPLTREGEARDVGFVTSSVRSPHFRRALALGYVRTAFAAPGTTLVAGGFATTVAALPFTPETS